MRQDMGKVITERPRYGSSNPSQKTRLTVRWNGWDEDYAIETRMGMSRHRQHGFGAREFTDVLGPIYRWLDKQVGRPWNASYSELCEVLDKRKLTHAHVIDHVFREVETDIFRGTDGLWRAFPYGGMFNGLYVDPTDGILKRQTLPKNEKPEKIEKVPVDDLKIFEIKKGIWYLCEYKMLDPEEIVAYRNPKTGRLTSWSIPGDDIFTVPVRRKELHPKGEKGFARKKQASKKELRLLRTLLAKKS